MLIPPLEWSALLAARRSSSRSKGRIQLRRFAGPTAYVDHMTPLRIAHLTDIHVGRVTPYAVQREAVALTNAQNPDLVVITGDFVCHSQLYLDQLTEIARSFTAPVVAVLGNHDYWAGADEVRAALVRAHVEVLSNRNTIITIRHQKLQIVGLDDAYTGHARRDEADKGLRPEVPTLALSHIAEEADALWKYNIPLVLSGHTHGGQVTVARLHELAVGKLAGHKYIHGLYGSRARKDGVSTGAVYVGAGIGAAVIPFRLGDRGKREVTIFELGCAPGAFDEHHAEQPALPGRKPTIEKQARRAAQVVAKRERRARKRTQTLKIDE
jgi:predicted MPP superfamily phosphohydrolase